jgi:hypothetical protein
MRVNDRLGHEVLAAFRPVGYEDWGLVAKMDVAEAYAPSTGCDGCCWPLAD